MRVLPFRSSLVGQCITRLAPLPIAPTSLCSRCLAYVGFDGVAMGRGLRERVA
jgi:hypothetical protein